MKRKITSYSDIELAELMSGNEKEAQKAFRELYDRYSSLVHAYCHKIMGDEDAAEDVFQETFIKFYRSASQSSKMNAPNTNIAGYIFKIARNLCFNQKRNKKPTVAIEDMEYLLHDHQNYENEELLNLITQSLELIGEDLKEAFVLKEYAGMSYAETADIIGITETNAKSRVFRAKKQIKEILQPYLKDIQKL